MTHDRELVSEDVVNMASDILKIDIEDILKENEAKISKACKKGKVYFKNKPELQKLTDINKKIFYSIQDTSGALRASIKDIYYMIWVRDGGMACTFNGYAGWTDSLKEWCEFLLVNPTELSTENYQGKMFGQLVNKKISKWEEDGAFYAVWSAFAYWTQTGDNKFLKGEYMEVLKEAMKWIENYCFDEKKGLYGRYFYCESPLLGSRDNGWDNAIGKPCDYTESSYEGKSITRSYDIYINALMCSSYRMIAAAENKENAEIYLHKAKSLEDNLKPLFIEGLPSYGYLIDENKEMIISKPYGMDKEDYIWGLSFAPLFSRSFVLNPIRAKLYDNMMKNKFNYFIASYCSLLASIDTEFFKENKIMESIEYLAEQCYRPGKYMPMAYSMVEMLDIEDGNIYHDIRPQCFSIGAYLATICNFAIHRMPFGIAIRSSEYIEKICQYEYQGAEFDILYKGTGNISRIYLNGNLISNSYQIPHNKIIKDQRNIVSIELETQSNIENVLVSSTVKLNSIDSRDKLIIYNIDAFGHNELVFKDLYGSININDKKRLSIDLERKEIGGYSYICFEGHGSFNITLQVEENKLST